jgi:hypothetical protein
VLGSGEQDRRAFRDHHCVLVVRRKAAVGSPDGPPVRLQGPVSRSHRDDRFNGDDQAFREPPPACGIGVVGDGRGFVDGPSDAMAAKRA